MASSPDENLALEQDKQLEFDQKVKKLKTNSSDDTGTVYIAHLPHGFYENEIKAYFSQFGVVNKIRLARSKKTGGHKGYGYVQFGSADVAKIAADAMNNYLMFEKLLKCEFVPNEKLHPSLWIGANKKFVWVNKAKQANCIHNKAKSAASVKKAGLRLKQRDLKRRAKLLELGIKYDFSGYGQVKKVKKTKKNLAVKDEKTLKVKNPKKSTGSLKKNVSVSLKNKKKKTVVS